jgi:hypothetical protein
MDDLKLPRPAEEANLAIVTGTILEEPTGELSRGGDPVTVLLLGIKAPDAEAHDYTACLEVEALDSIADPHRQQLRKGRRLVVLGRLTGVGLWATVLVSAAPRHPEHGVRSRP